MTFDRICNAKSRVGDPHFYRMTTDSSVLSLAQKFSRRRRLPSENTRVPYAVHCGFHPIVMPTGSGAGTSPSPRHPGVQPVRHVRSPRGCVAHRCGTLGSWRRRRRLASVLGQTAVAVAAGAARTFGPAWPWSRVRRMSLLTVPQHWRIKGRRHEGREWRGFFDS